VKTFTDTSLSASTEFFYRVRAFNLGNNSAYTNEANATTLPNAPNAPSNLAVQPGKKRMTLDWSDNADNETGFKIERKQGTAVNFTQIAVLPASAVTYADTGLGVSTKYAYRIRAYNTGGNSAYSTAVEGTTFPNPPAAPTTLAAKVMSSGQIDLLWQDKSGNEAGFKIERKLGSTGTFTQIATVGANVVSFSSLNLNANSKYFYRVRAYNAGGNSAYSNTMEATTLPKAPAAPGNLVVVVVSFSRLNLAWQDKSANEDSFQIERKLGAAGTFAEIAKLPTNIATFADTGLSASTQYFYRVRASNIGGQSPYSNETNATTNPGPPNAPSGLTATPVNQTRIALVWTDNANNEAGFKIERKTGAGAFAQVGAASANATSFADTGLVANTEYIYRVRSSNVTANSAYTNEATAKTFPVPPAAPAGLTAGPLVNLQINLAWQDKSANEDSFRVERKQGAAGAFAVVATLPKNATSYTDGNLNPVTQYFYRVRAMNLGGNSGYTNEAAATTLVSPPLAPSNLTGTTAGQTQINLAWQDNSNNEDGFKIERKPNGGEFTEIASMAANVKNYQDNGLSQDIEYVYRVRAFNAGGNSGYSSEVTAITLPNPPKTPVNLKATPATNKRINLAWVDSSKNEAGFKVERKKGAAGTYAQIASIGANVTSYADTTLLAATQYFYRVRAFNIGGNSGYSLEANGTTLPNPPKKPANLTATAVSNKRINLAWADSSTNENGFRIERKKGAGTYAQIAQVNANVKSYADTTLTANSAYSYRVRAFNAGGNSLYSNEVTTTTLPNPPKAPAKLAATAVSKTRINLAWADSSNDETGFRIERKTGAAGTYAQVGSVNANVKAFADTNLVGGTQYFYRVRAFNTGGNSGYSNEANAKTFPNAPAAPTALAATVAGGDQVTIAWQDNSNDEDGFKVESKLGAEGTYTQVATVGPNVTNYESTDLTEGVTYFYRVRAFNVGGNSAYSNEAGAIPSSGTNFALNKTANASSTDSSSAVSLGNDGNAVTFWRSGFVNSASAQQTYQVQLHQSLAITIGRVVVKWYQTYYANEYDIQVSNDASNWTTVHTNPAVVTGTQEIIFAATPAKYVRLVTKKNNKSNYRIAEFEVYGATIAKSAGETPQSGTSEAVIPESLVLEQNYPNPFNPSTTISFALPEGMHVTLKVINVAGQEVAALVDGYQERGIHRVTFNGRKLPSGVYYAVMKAGETTQTKRMVLAK
jgi:titin